MLQSDQLARFVPLNDLSAVFANDNYTDVYLADGDDFLMRRLLKSESPVSVHEWLKIALTDFFGLNRTHLAHSSAVKTFTAIGKGRLSVQLVPRPATEILVSQETAATFRTWAGR